MIDRNLWIKKPKFKKKYIDDLIDYFDIEASFFEKIETSTKKEIKEYANSLPTFQWYCSKIKVDRETVNEWIKEAQDNSYLKKDKKDKLEFYEALKKCREISENIWIQNWLKWLYPASFATFVGKNIFEWWEEAKKDKNNLYDKYKDEIENMTEEEVDKLIMEMLA